MAYFESKRRKEHQDIYLQTMDGLIRGQALKLRPHRQAHSVASGRWEIEEREAENGTFQNLDSMWAEAELSSGCHRRLRNLSVTLRHVCEKSC